MSKKKTVTSALIGNIVEYYDFGLYAVYAKIIGSLYFPSDDEFTQTLSALCVFAVGFLMRPIGGVIFGHIGDRYGRKVSLTISIILMGLCTLAIGILPSYNNIGMIAPILLVLIRLVQGICVGGEGVGSAIFALEHTAGWKPGFVGSLVQASAMSGTLLANLIAIIILHTIGEDEFTWRIAYILGAVMGGVGLYMRYQVKETPVFQSTKDQDQLTRSPLIEVIKQKWRKLLVVACLGGLTAALAYMIRGYFNVFFETVLGYSIDVTKYLTSYALIVVIACLPPFGILADKIGYRKFLYVTCFAIIITVIPVYITICDSAQDLTSTILGITLFSILTSAICAPAYPYAVSAFSPKIRYSGVAVSWNLGIAILGGTVPVIARYLTEKVHIYAPAYYIVFVSILFVIVSYLTRKDSH